MINQNFQEPFRKMNVFNTLIGLKTSMKDIFFNGNGIRIYIFFSASTILFFLSTLYGLDFTDSFYHLNQALNPAEGKHLYPFLGSSLIVREIIFLIGPKIIYLRLFNALLLFSSFLLPFFAFRVKNTVNKLFLISLGLILFLPFTSNILGYDTLSIFFLSLIFSLSINYFRRPGFFKLLWISLACSLAVLVRLPNAMVLFFVGLNFLFLQKEPGKSSGWKISLLFLFIAAAGIFLGYFLYYNGWNDFIQASANSDSHLILNLLKNYFRDSKQLLVFLSFIFFTYFVYTKVEKKISSGFPAFLFLCTFIIFFSVFLFPTKYSFNYSLFIFGLSLSFIIVRLYHWKDNSMVENKVYGLYLCFLFINLLGSNTGLLKGYSLFVLFPFILSFGELRQTERKYWFVLIFALIPFSLVNKVYGIYEEKNILVLTKVPQNELLTPIRTSDVRKRFLDSIEEQVKDLQAQNFQVYFYGDKSHIFNYLYPESSLGIASFFQPVDDPIYFPQIKKELRAQKGKSIALFIVDSYPRTNDLDRSLFEEMLLKLNFFRMEDKSEEYRIYLKKI